MKLALCNEVLRDRPFADMQAGRCAGLPGLELAPFTLTDDVAALDEHHAARLRQAAAARA